MIKKQVTFKIGCLITLLLAITIASSKTKTATHNLTSEILSDERQVYVSLPNSYAYSKHNYPVVFVLDAEFLFDVTQAMVHLRAARNYMPESIVVGLPNDFKQRFSMAPDWKFADGRNFFNPTGKPNLFTAFMKQELIPFIENKYRTNDFRTIIGMSPTTGPVFEALFSEPGLFQAHISLAMALDMQTQNDVKIADKIIERAKQKRGHKKPWLYMALAGNDVRKKPERKSSFENINQQLAQIKDPQIKHHIEIIDDEEHYAVAIPGLLNALKMIYPREMWNIDYVTIWDHDDPTAALTAHYQKLSKQYGITINPLLDGYFASHNILGLGRRLDNHQKPSQRLAVYQFGLSLYPESEKIHYVLSEAYEQKNDIKKARKYAQSALDLAVSKNNPYVKSYQTRLTSVQIKLSDKDH